MAWQEGHSRRHETDIYEMMVLHYLGKDAYPGVDFDEGFVDEQATALGHDVLALWQAIKEAASQAAT